MNASHVTRRRSRRLRGASNLRPCPGGRESPAVELAAELRADPSPAAARRVALAIDRLRAGSVEEATALHVLQLRAIGLYLDRLAAEQAAVS